MELVKSRQTRSAKRCDNIASEGSDFIARCHELKRQKSEEGAWDLINASIDTFSKRTDTPATLRVRATKEARVRARGALIRLAIWADEDTWQAAEAMLDQATLKGGFGDTEKVLVKHLRRQTTCAYASLTPSRS